MEVGRRSFSVTITASPNGFTVKLGRSAMGHGATIREARAAALNRLDQKVAALDRELKPVEKDEL
jgi:hypothetical protein